MTGWATDQFAIWPQPSSFLPTVVLHSKAKESPVIVRWNLQHIFWYISTFSQTAKVFLSSKLHYVLKVACTVVLLVKGTQMSETSCE